ncbi:MAG: DUF4402 domain-containing protein [Gemmatimonadales bacterium]
MKLALALLPLLLIAVPATKAEAQLSYVTGQRTLAFGGVMRGVAKHILPGDPIRSGQFEFRATLNNTVQITFTLPNRLNGPAGATMPVSFSTTDGNLKGQGPTSLLIVFNPNVANTWNLVSSNTFNVWIGGTVNPGGAQAFGAYSNTISMTVTVQ